MRILHLGKFYPPHPGGIESALAELARAQVEAGAIVEVLAHAPPGHWRTVQRSVGGVRVTEVGCWGQWLYAPVSPGLPWRLSRLISRLKPDVIHVHVPNTSAFWILLIASARRIRCVVHWHADIPLDSASRGLRFAYPMYRPWERALLRHATAIIATSAAYRDSSVPLREWPGKVDIIPLGLADATLPTRQDAAVGWPGGHLRLLAVGRLSHYKGFEILINALRELPQAALLLIGSGEREAQLKAQVLTCGLDARVTFAGSVDAATLAQAYSDADVFCLPSLDRAEAFGMVLLEAMRAGLPTVASAIAGSGVGHVVVDGETGLLVPPGDTAALRAALQCLSNDAGLRGALGRAGRIRWRSEFTPPRLAQRSLDLYARILDRNPHHAAPAPPE